MQADLRELLSITAPVYAVVEASTTDAEEVTVKGFASVESLDRSKDLVPPEEFDIDQFMAAPTLLVNHDFWIDRMGNRVAAGRPDQVYVAKLVKQDDPEVWGVQEVKSREVRTTIPKARVPNLTAGARGLFVVATVTEYDVIKMVQRGELSAFSWRGLVNVDYRVNAQGETERVFKGIDLWEISLVNIPDNPDATFVVGKNANGHLAALGGQPYAVQLVVLEGTRFDNRAAAVECLKTHKLRHDAIREEGGNFYALQQPPEHFPVEKLVTVRLQNGVYVVAGPRAEHKAAPAPGPGDKTQTDKSRDALAIVVGGADVLAALATQSPSTGTPIQKEAEMADNDKDAAKAGDAGSGEDKSKGSQIIGTDAQKAAEALGQSVAGAVTEALKPTLDAMSETLKTVGEGFKVLAEAQKAAGAKDEPTDEEKAKAEAEKAAAEAEAKKKADEEAEAKKKADAEAAAGAGDGAGKTDTEKKSDTDKKTDTEPQPTAIEKMLAGLATGLQEVQKTVAALGKVTPPDLERDEKVEAEKKAAADPNHVFDGLWPFLPKTGGGE
jgi:hypothetical protein